MLTPLEAELGTVLYDVERDLWRDDAFELYAWSSFPEILIVDTADYETQAALFKRLAFFVEKRGYAGSLMTDDELAGRHGWNAHNYHPDDLARFFTVADRQDIELTELEHRLRAILAEQGLVQREGDGFAPGRGGIISISQESSAVLRELLLSHEALHGIYYSVEQFREAVNREWSALSNEERAFWRFMLGGMSYNPDDDYLMQNEFQAYLLQQEPQAAHGYFHTRVIPRLKQWYPNRIDYIDSFLAEHPTTFRDSAQALSRSLAELTGVRAGRLLVEAPKLSR